jgi:hypothetical protein
VKKIGSNSPGIVFDYIVSNEATVQADVATTNLWRKLE